MLPQAITAYLNENAAREGAPPPGPTDDLFDAGVLDSFSLVDLVAMLEEQFGIEIPDSDVRAENFRTVRAVEQYVDARRGQA